MPAGRPTDYTPALLKKAYAYLEKIDKATKAGKLFYPSIAEFALQLGIRRETVHVWAKEKGKEEFSNIVERVLAVQELSLTENGLMNKFNPTITKLLLSKHGYREGHDLTSRGEQIQVPIYGGVSKHDGDTQDIPTPKKD